MASQEVDLLRSAIVFASSGLDASMQRLVNDAARYLILHPMATTARVQYEQFLQGELRAAVVNGALQTAVISRDPAEATLRYYLAVRTKASYQGSGDLEKRVRNVIGISNARLPTATLRSLDDFFLARNRIVHSLDYEDVANSNSRKRRHLRIEEAHDLCNQVFAVAADLFAASAEVLAANR
jgi:hypothetical protein